MRALNINVKMFAATVGPALPKFTEELGDTAEFTLGFSQWEPRVTLGYPGMKEFIEAYEQGYGVKPNYHASGAYTVVQILEAAVKHADSVDPQKVRDALASIEVETIRGLYKPDAQGMSIRESLTFQIQKGERVIVWPKDKAEAKYILPMPRWDERPKH
jgi:branched-chain amino acid transport system substrate-binding protein